MTLHSLSLAAADLFEDEIRNATLPDGTKVAIYNIGGTYYVTDDTCTHEAASLSEEGAIDGTNVICGWHFCGFDIATGAATASPCSEPLRTYPVHIIEGCIHVEC
ncbi:MAG: ferredoxin [Panacagrimonas sp.]|jgi:p-cumate 2,3-dioxygenase ferredoxin subunit|nr:Rieske 2Fe-2S domain-containing protein [Panacagrimonas sp.]MCC2655297.1 ferredoxin [Panacagrimonas sp.]